MHLLRLFLLLLLLLPFGLNAQGYNFVTYDVRDGLALSQVHGISQDTLGNLWFATYGGGLSRFDGHSFKNYGQAEGLKETLLWDVFVGSDGNVWLGTSSKGVIVFDGKEFRSLGKGTALDSTGVEMIREFPKGTFWICGNEKGLFRYQDSVLTRIYSGNGLPDDRVYSVCPGGKDEALIGTRKGLYHYKDGNIRPVGPPQIRKAWITSLLQDQKGQIWAGVNAQGVYRFSETDTTFFGNEKGLPSVAVWSLFEGRNGAIWVGTIGGGARITGNQIDHFTEKQGLCNNSIYNVFEDREGNVWFTTRGSGACKYTGDRFIHLGRELSSTNKVLFAISEDQQGLKWFGGSALFREQADGSYLSNKSPEVKARGFIYALCKGKDAVYMGSPGGLTQFKNGTFRKIPIDFEGETLTIFSLYEDKEGYLWISHRGGVWRWKKGEALEMSTIDPNFGRQSMCVSGDSEGNLWISFFGKGLGKYDGESLRIFTEADGLPNLKILNTREGPGGNIWIGTYQGLVRFDGQSFCTIGKENGLISNTIYSQVFDEKGRLWLGTDQGLNCLTLDESGMPAHIQYFGVDEGFTFLECNQNAVHRDKNGMLWFGTIDGVTRVDPTLDFGIPEPPEPVITSASLFLEPTDWEKKEMRTGNYYPVPEDLALSHDENYLSFEFTGITHTFPEKVRYNYRLEGLDPNWSPASTFNRAVYANLSPGDYVFRLRSFFDTEPGNFREMAYSFRIRPPFWQSWWFIGFAIVALLGLIRAGMYARERSLRQSREKLKLEVNLQTNALKDEKEKVEAINLQLREEKEKAENAVKAKADFLATMSHEIRTPMNAVIGLTELVQQTHLDLRQKDLMEKIRLSGENMIGVINDILDFSRIESGKLTLEIVEFDPEEALEDVLQMLSNVAWKKGLSLIGLVSPALPKTIRTDITRFKQILVNLVGNAIKFTEKGSVRVIVYPEGGEGEIKVSVRDTGIGIDPAQQEQLFEAFMQAEESTTRRFGGSGLGLSICARLVHLMGGEIWVESTADEGAEFFFTIQNGSKEKSSKSRIAPGEFEGKTLFSDIHMGIPRSILEDWALTCGLRFTGPELPEKGSPPPDFILKSAQTPPLPDYLRTEDNLLLLVSDQDRGAPIPDWPDDQWRVLRQPITSKGLLMGLRGELLKSGKGKKAKPIGPDSATAPLKILLAEDNEINQEVALGMLNTFGYEATVAATGPEVLQKLGGRAYDLVLMDMQMPGMNGLEVTRAVRASDQYGQPRIVAMTANVSAEARRQCREAGMDDFVGKPTQLFEMAAALERAVEDLEISLPEKVVSEDNGGIDLSELREISGGSDDFVLAILSKIRKRLPASLDELETLIENRDWPSVKALAHSTKSASGYTGSRRLKALFQELESRAQEERDLDKVETLFEELKVVAGSVIQELDAEMSLPV